MPPLASSLVIGLGSIGVVCGLILLLIAHTLNPRAKPTLLVYGHPWRLRGVAIVMVLAGGLGLGLSWVYAPAGPRPEPFQMADRPRLNDDDRQASPAHEPTRPGIHDRAQRVTGAPVDTDRPGPRQPGNPEASPPESPVNLTGEWTITNTVVETSYASYRDLRLGFRLVVQHDGPAFTGTGEKYLENGRKIPVAARRPIRLQGRVAEGAVIEATFEEDGYSRRIQGRFQLTMLDPQHLTGTFVSTAANARGTSQWRRTSVRQGAPVPAREPPPEQGTPPVIALVAPGPGQQVTTAQVHVRGTATGAPGIVRVDVQVNGERRVQRAAPGTATVDFAELITLRHGPNDLVVTAVDRQHRAAHQRVTVTRVQEDPGASAPGEAPRQAVPADRRTARQDQPRLHLGMSQAEVRALLGAPVSVEEPPGFVFWHYGPEAYVVFEQGTDRVYGWVGVSS